MIGSRGKQQALRELVDRALLTHLVISLHSQVAEPAAAIACMTWMAQARCVFELWVPLLLGNGNAWSFVVHLSPLDERVHVLVTHLRAPKNLLQLMYSNKRVLWSNAQTHAIKPKVNVILSHPLHHRTPTLIILNAKLPCLPTMNFMFTSSQKFPP